jgi:predicted transcriptional regulator
MSDHAQKVLDEMKSAGKPLKASEIETATGLNDKEVAKAMKGLKKDGKIVSPVRCFWAPAE